MKVLKKSSVPTVDHLMLLLALLSILLQKSMKKPSGTVMSVRLNLNSLLNQQDTT